MIAFIKAVGALAWALLTWLFELLVRVVNWLRKPGNPLKSLCAVLAFGLLCSGLQAYEREREIASLAMAITEQARTCATEKGELATRVDQCHAALATVAGLEQRKLEALEELRGEVRQTLDLSQRTAAAADARAADFARRYGQMPATCQAALAALDTACPELEGY